MICPDCNQQIMPFGCGCSEMDKNNQLKLHNAELIAENKELIEENEQLRKALKGLTNINVPIEHFKNNKDAYVTAVELLKN